MELNIDRIRNLIIDIHSVDNEHIIFDTDLAIELGYNLEEKAIADEMLSTLPDWSEDVEEIITDMKYIFDDFPYPVIYYFSAIRMIVMLDYHANIYSFVGREELDKTVAEERELTKYIEWVMEQEPQDE